MAAHSALIASQSVVVQTGISRGRGACARQSIIGRPADGGCSVVGVGLGGTPASGRRCTVAAAVPLRATVKTVRNAGGGAVNEIQP